MASRMVGKESAKCRSGRDGLRAMGTGPSRRGGGMPHALSDDEGVAADDDGDVVVPADPATSFEVVESQLGLHLLVGLLGSPALLEDPDDLLAGHRSRQSRERVLRRRVFLLGPLYE